jgi:hypothetical protein
VVSFGFGASKNARGFHRSVIKLRQGLALLCKCDVCDVCQGLRHFWTVHLGGEGDHTSPYAILLKVPSDISGNALSEPRFPLSLAAAAW